MPIYKFKCKKCDKMVKKITDSKNRNDITCPECNTIMEFELPYLSKDSVAVYDLVDKDRGKQVMRNINEIMRERAKEHNQDQEAGEFIEKNGGMRAVMSGYLDPEKKKIIR